ncbi:hypothetical protein [Aeromonas sp. 603359]|uniref:hypothetical protein n=1 Tax=Aeromonas sp. 603359 TaxID=2712046 RepID=UPI003BA391B2
MADLFKNSGKDAWAALHHAIVDRLGGSQELRGLLIQPLQVAERADWDTPNRLLNMYREQRIANQVPTWNAIYIPNAGINVPGEYHAFLDQLNSKVIADAGVADPKKLERLDLERKAAQDKLQKNEFFVNHQWDRYVANNRGKPPLTRSQWEVDFGYAAAKFGYQQEVNAAVANYLREVNTAGGDLLEVGRAIGAFTDPRQRIPLPQDEDDAMLPSDNWQYWYRGGLGDSIESFLATNSPSTITLEETSTRTTRFQERWSGSVNVSYFGVFGAGGGASNETIKTHAETDTSMISIHFANIQSFPVERGQWFMAGLISRFRDRMPQGFWGQSGRLNLIPTSVILVRGVKIVVNTSSTVTDYFFSKRTAGGSAGFQIGPWRVGGGGSRTTIEESYEMRRTATGFELEDMSGRAQIIAVASIRNADLLASQVENTSLFRSLSSADESEGMRLLEASRRCPLNLPAEFGVR